MPSTRPPHGKPSRKSTLTTTIGSGEDAQLWRHVTESVTPLDKPRRKKARDAAGPAVTATPAVKSKSPPAVSSRPAPPPPVTTPPPQPAGFDRATETKFRKGQLAIEGRLDLHGMTQDAAYRALNRFLDRAIAAEKRTLLIITGKGRVSEGGGVLRRLLPSWLQAGPYGHAVLACTPAQIKDGGAGAYYLRLRKQRRTD